MQYKLIHSEKSPRLLLIFAGWGMDAGVFGHLRRPGYDIMVVWDYRSFHIDWSCTDSYDEICLLAWSMGVYAASQTVQAIESRITKRVAVNGTPYPVDDRMGIPEAIFNGTLAGLNDLTLNKFYRRMCASRSDMALFDAHKPARAASELKDELQAVADRLILSTPTHADWDLAVACKDDRIFPFHNQRTAWNSLGVPVQVEEGGHFFDFNRLLDAHFIDKTLVGTRFGSGTATYDSHAAVQTDAVERLVEMIRMHGMTSEIGAARNAVLEIGSGSGFLTRKIAAMVNEAMMTIWDLAAPMPDGLPPGRRYDFANCDAELALRRVRAASFDHIFSASTIQWFNSPESFVHDCHRALRPGGCAFLTTYTRGNRHEISDITGNALPLLTPGRWRELAEPLFDIIAFEAYERDLDFESPADVLRHLKLTGVNSLSRSSRGTVSVRTIIDRYPMRLDGRYHLTYRPIIMILRKR